MIPFSDSFVPVLAIFLVSPLCLCVAGSWTVCNALVGGLASRSAKGIGCQCPMSQSLGPAFGIWTIGGAHFGEPHD